MRTKKANKTETSQDNKLLLTVGQVAEILGICERTVWRLHDSGQMPDCVRLGRSVRWRKSDIEAWVGTCCQKIA